MNLLEPKTGLVRISFYKFSSLVQTLQKNTYIQTRFIILCVKELVKNKLFAFARKKRSLINIEDSPLK
jgi:hypothetical protein